MRNSLTVLIITKNASETLKRTLESVEALTGEIILVDDYSIDTTLDIAQSFGCKIRRFHSYDLGEQRGFALTQVDSEWTLVLDSDEVLTQQNREEIKNILLCPEYDGYYLHFQNHLFGKKLMFGELHKKLVLFKTQKASIESDFVHEQYHVEGRVGELKSKVLHYSYRSPSQIIKKFVDYSVRQAKQYKKENIKYGIREFMLNPIHMFYSRFIEDKGYKDGLTRVFLDGAFASMEFLSYAFIPFVKDKKRISIDCGSFFVDGIVKSGINRVIQGIYSQRKKDNQYYWFSFNGKAINHLPNRLYSQVWLPLATIIRNCDVFLGTGGTIPHLLRYVPIQKMLFLYDFGFFSSPDKYDLSAKRLQIQTEKSMEYADTIIILHTEIYKELGRRYPEYLRKAVVISSGADHLNDIIEQPTFIQPKKPLILAVGVVKPVKRIDKMISVVGDTYCVIAGPQEKGYMKTLKVGHIQNIQFINNFNDKQLKWLYIHADVLVNTSDHEGFCFPVLEALTLGLPVVAYDLPLFREYKKYFNHLTLVSNENEMKEYLQKKEFIRGRKNLEHPYHWTTFSNELDAVIYQRARPRRSQDLGRRKIAFIGVLYNTKDTEKKRLEREIKEIGLPSYEIYWIDNSTNSKGYAAGINEGIRNGLWDNCYYFFAFNPDISLKGITAESLLSAINIYDVWGYAMKQGIDIFYGGEIDRWRLSGGLIKTKPYARFVSVDFVSGSLIGFSRLVVQKNGMWDERYFMYYEDVDYCIRAKKAGFQVGIDTETMYEHFETSKTNIKKEIWIAKSRWRFFWRYANGLQIVREMMRLPKTILNI